MFKSVLFIAAFIVSSYAHAGVTGDIDGDGKVGLPEAIYSLQSLSGMRPPSVSAQAKVISRCIQMDPQVSEQTVMTVPVGKVIVITDIVLIKGPTFWLYENGSPKIYIDAEVSRQYHFYSGIPFSSGTSIIAYGSGNVNKMMFISGYEADQ
jgi:hypothetical protein